MPNITIQYSNTRYIIGKGEGKNTSYTDWFNVSLPDMKQTLDTLLSQKNEADFFKKLFDDSLESKRKAYFALLEELVECISESDTNLVVSYVNEDTRERTQSCYTALNWLKSALDLSKQQEMGRKLMNQRVWASQKIAVLALIPSLLGAGVWAGYPIYLAAKVGAQAAMQAFTHANPWVIVGLVVCVLAAATATTVYFVGRRTYNKKNLLWTQAFKNYCDRSKVSKDGVEVEVDDDEALAKDSVEGEAEGQPLVTQEAVFLGTSCQPDDNGEDLKTIPEESDSEPESKESDSDQVIEIEEDPDSDSESSLGPNEYAM